MVSTDNPTMSNTLEHARASSSCPINQHMLNTLIILTQLERVTPTADIG
jgi:hypothetical protein